MPIYHNTERNAPSGEWLYAPLQVIIGVNDQEIYSFNHFHPASDVRVAKNFTVKFMKFNGLYIVDRYSLPASWCCTERYPLKLVCEYPIVLFVKNTTKVNHA